MGNKNLKRRSQVLLASLMCMSILLLFFVPSIRGKASSKGFEVGDVVASADTGKVKWYGANGILKNTLQTGVSSIPAGMAFDVDGNLYVTTFEKQGVVKFDKFGNRLGAFGSGIVGFPESIVLDEQGNVYVGTVQKENAILKFDSQGNLIKRYMVAVENRGADWIELASDQCTMYYTSEGSTIKRFDVCTGKQLSDFYKGVDSNRAFALRILPDNSVLFANEGQISLISYSGEFIKKYTLPGESFWFSLNRDPDGKSFWAGSIFGKFYKFDIATGKKLLGPIEACINSTRECMAGVAIFGELTAATHIADLVVTQESAIPSVPLGQALGYTIKVTNLGPDDASEVVLTNTLPEYIVINSGQVLGGICQTVGQVVTCKLGDVPKQQTLLVTISVTAQQAGTLVSRAEVISKANDPDLKNNQSELSLSALSADLSVKLADATDINSGSSFTEKISVSNDGPTSASNVVVTSAIPTNMHYLSNNTQQGSCNENGDKLICELGNLTANQKINFDILWQPTGLGAITRQVQIKGDEPDPVLSNNSATANGKIIGSDLLVVIQDSPDPITAGELLNYTISVSNLGPVQATNVVVTGTLPANSEFVQAISDIVICSTSDPVTIQCQIKDPIINQQKVDWQIQVRPQKFGDIKAVVEVNSQVIDPERSNNTASSDTHVKIHFLWWLLIPLLPIGLIFLILLRRSRPARGTSTAPTRREGPVSGGPPAKLPPKPSGGGSTVTHGKTPPPGKR